jgi:hypothetical protein
MGKCHGPKCKFKVTDAAPLQLAIFGPAGHVLAFHAEACLHAYLAATPPQLFPADPETKCQAPSCKRTYRGEPDAGWMAVNDEDGNVLIEACSIPHMRLATKQNRIVLA